MLIDGSNKLSHLLFVSDLIHLPARLSLSDHIIFMELNGYVCMTYLFVLCTFIYLSTTRISMQYHPWYFFWYTTYIFRTWMHFLRVNIKFYDAVSMLHDVIITTNPFPYIAKFMFVGVRNNKTQQVRCWKINRIRIHVYSVALYQKYLTREKW